MDRLRHRLANHPYRSILIAFALGVAVVMLATTVGASTESHDTELQATKGAKRLLFQTKTGAINYTTDNVQVTGSGTITVPSVQTGFLVATFTAESVCTGTSGGWCNIIINCDGVEAQPAVGTDFAFDSVGPTSSSSSWHGLTVTRRSNPFTGGSHSCEVRENLLGATNFRLDDWTFQIEFWRQ